jgi:hypothetical protein
MAILKRHLTGKMTMSPDPILWPFVPFLANAVTAISAMEDAVSKPK